MRRWLGALLAGAMAAILLMTVHGSSNKVSAQGMEPECPLQSNSTELIEANAGDNFAIGMLSNPSTGYSWEMDTPPDPNVAQFVANTYIAPDTSLIGAGGRECWIFSAIASGSTTVTFNYLRPFDPPGTRPANTQTFTIVVN
jgi:inhibitor of cysteine peptidase